MKKIKKSLVISLTTIFLGACGSKTATEYHESNRNNVIDGTSLMVSIDDNLPPIHSFAVPIMAGDSLIIQDLKSTDLIYTAYDIYNDSTVGKFGRFGSGPGEIGNPLLEFYDQNSHTLYIGNGNSNKLVGFHLPEAVSDSTYKAVDKLSLDFNNGILYPHVIDEHTVMCTTYSDFATRTSQISSFNLNTGEVAVIDSVTPGKGCSICIAVSKKDNRIYSAEKQRDLIRILSLDGKVISTIYGPEYDSNIDQRNSFFAEAQICGDKVAFVYTGPDSDKRYNKIILTDLDGKYLNTLVFDETIWGIEYHDKTGRLYLTTKGNPQIGYIELDKIAN